MITFTTETGSVYEADTRHQLIRRLSGVNDPTPRQGDDGVWKPYKYVKAGDTGQHAFAVGMPAVIVWAVTGDGTVEECTMTSPVTVMTADGVPCIVYYPEGNQG